jgi:transcriptional regulator GlxA family with amidase domain
MPLLRVMCVLFPKFELLDVCGPLEMFGMVESVLRDKEATTHRKETGYSIITTTLLPGGGGNNVPANQGPSIVLDQSDIPSNASIHALFIPGGAGVRSLWDNDQYLRALTRAVHQSQYCLTVCTGSGLLSRTGLLNNRGATSNKRAWRDIVALNAQVRWQPKARWVVDGKFWTSSGVAAGMDMALAFIAHDFGPQVALAVAKRAEYVWNQDADNDLFAAKL